MATPIYTSPPYMDARHILILARKDLRDPKAWMKGRYSNAPWAGDIASDKATAWCSLGAIYRHSGGMFETPSAARLLALDALAKVTGLSSELVIKDWNDRASTTHADVLAAFDKAIADLAAKEGK